tara:strand:- start:258 stop:908 length:651 start_codon:yes stop_codon:yes gene_type:complete
MFTGIVERVGKVKSIHDKKECKEFCIYIDHMFLDVCIGDSISVNGVCLTITKKENNCMNFDVVKETLNKTNLGSLSIGAFVNLERALSLSSRLSGHILQGHVEGVGIITDYKKKKNEIVLSIGVDPSLLIYCIPKGSIALDGVSLTIAKIYDNIIDVALIPHTLENTNLDHKSVGDSLNIETDIIGKYIHQFMSQNEDYDNINSFLIKTLNNLGLS